jgi:hypothetical protein
MWIQINCANINTVFIVELTCFHANVPKFMLKTQIFARPKSCRKQIKTRGIALVVVLGKTF